MSSESLLLPHGGYEHLRSYKIAAAVYDATVVFCDRFIPWKPEVAANALLCAIHQATYLLRRQVESQGRVFLEQGGFTERLYAARAAQRSDRSDKSDGSDSREPTLVCPQCGKPMRRRTAHKGSHAGKAFWGCSGYPECCSVLPS